MTLKEAMNRQWREQGVAQSENLCIWSEDAGHVASSPGEKRNPKPDPAAEAFKRRRLSHSFPARVAYCGDAPLPIPDWVRVNFKRNCPRNYKALCESYGTEKFRE